MLSLIILAGTAAVIVGGLMPIVERRAGRLIGYAGIFTLGLALIDLGRGRWAEALERFDRLTDPESSLATVLVTMMTVPDKIEAAVHAGHPELGHAAFRITKRGRASQRQRGCDRVWSAAERC